MDWSANVAEPSDEKQRSGEQDFFKRFKVDIDPEAIDDSLKELGAKVRGLYDQGRYTKVRLLYKGKQLGPDIPVTLFVAGEVASFWWMGPIRALIVTMGVRTFLEVELVHEADAVVLEGVELYMDGEVDAAEAKYRKALRMKPDDTAGLYNLGVLLRVTGRKEEAVKCFRQAASDEEHPDGERARAALERMNA